MTIVGTSTQKAAEFLRKGELVAIPTETVYGLAGNALNPASVTEIFSVKNRPFFNPLIVHAHSSEAAEEFILDFPASLKLLADAFWPGPLTVLLPRNPEKIHDLVTAASPRVAVRVPDHSLCLELLRSLPFPLAAPSANPFGYVSPTSAQHVLQQLQGKIPYILDGGNCRVGLESTIVGMEDSEKVVIYRHGGISVEEIAAVLGYLPENPVSHHISAPGMLKSHYATRAKLIFGNPTLLKHLIEGKIAGAITFQRKLDFLPEENQIVLSASGDLGEAARNLFSAMRRLDESGLDLILAEPMPDAGLGRAINDRLHRAASDRGVH